MPHPAVIAKLTDNSLRKVYGQNFDAVLLNEQIRIVSQAVESVEGQAEDAIASITSGEAGYALAEKISRLTVLYEVDRTQFEQVVTDLTYEGTVDNDISTLPKIVIHHLVNMLQFTIDYTPVWLGRSDTASRTLNPFRVQCENALRRLSDKHRIIPSVMLAQGTQQLNQIAFSTVGSYAHVVKSESEWLGQHVTEKVFKAANEEEQKEKQKKVCPTLERDYLDEPGALLESELFWRRHQKWLEQCGYMLRPRYHDNWCPSWEGTEKKWYRCEDGIHPWRVGVLDATRISDGSLVALKQVLKSRHPYEAEIGSFFSSEALVSDPKNYCIPLLEVLQVPDDEDLTLLVMPFLREYDSPHFDTVGEVVSFFSQIFEGLQFMHAHHVAHRDCDGRNIMMDGGHLYPKGFHPSDGDMKPDMSGMAEHYTRTQRPVKYYLVDFGISRRYKAEDLPIREPQIWGGDRTVPEFRKSDEPVDPFPTDVYYLGNMIRKDFLNRKSGFEFMEPLVADMVEDDPSKRPTMNEVVSRFEGIRKSLSSWKLRSRVGHQDELGFIEAYRSVAHWKRRFGYAARQTPAVPLP